MRISVLRSNVAGRLAFLLSCSTCLSAAEVKGTVIDALLRGRPWSVALDDLLTANGDGAPKQELAVTLMGYARSSPDRINGRLTPVIVYDPDSGRAAFSITMRKLKE